MSAVAPDLPIWARWFAALAVPIAAVVGVGLGLGNYRLAVRKREHELFERRIELYEKFREFFVEHFYGKGDSLHELPPGMYVKLVEPCILRIDLVLDRKLARKLREIECDKFFYPNNNPLVLEGQLRSLFAPCLRIGA